MYHVRVEVVDSWGNHVVGKANHPGDALYPGRSNLYACDQKVMRGWLPKRQRSDSGMGPAARPDVLFCL